MQRTKNEEGQVEWGRSGGLADLASVPQSYNWASSLRQQQWGDSVRTKAMLIMTFRKLRIDLILNPMWFQIPLDYYSCQDIHWTLENIAYVTASSVHLIQKILGSLYF